MSILKRENRIVLIVAIICLVFIGVIINYTYSFFSVEKTNSSIIAGEAESMKLDLTVVEKSSTNNGKLIPQLDEYITSAVKGRKGSCIDDNNNTVCQVYKITLKNSGSSSVYVNGEVVLNKQNNPNLKWAILNNTDANVLISPVLSGNIKTPEEKVLTSNELFTAGQTKYYFIVVWISEKGQAQIDSSKFTGVVNFSNSENDRALLTLNNLGLEDEVRTSTLDFGKISYIGTYEEIKSQFEDDCLGWDTLDECIQERYYGNDTFDDYYAKYYPTTDDTGIYITEDDLGTSYYFRGDVTNNYVKFGKNSSNQDMYWRIVRINGDGTVRMIYMGTDINTTSLTPVGRGVFNESDDDSTYVGYMYGDEGQDTYALTHSNKYDSTIKTFLEGTGNNDGWYYENIVATGYHDYVADAVYCNDRSFLFDDYGTVFYGAAGRLELETVVSPTLECDLADYTNDSFTQSPELGNGLLRYPVGLITLDEIVMAGGNYEVPNQKFYLYSSTGFWTMSPRYGTDDSTMYVFFDNYFDDMAGYLSWDNDIVPVISLKADAIIDGSGIKTDPFVVE